jgi:hypothetical protein
MNQIWDLRILFMRVKIFIAFRFNDISKYVCIWYESSLELVLGVVPMS